MRIVFQTSTLEAIQKAFGKRDLAKLRKEIITDKNGHRRTVWVKNDKVQPIKPQKKTGQDVQNMHSYAYSRTVGDTILFNDEKGKQHNGLITAVGKDGVTVKDEKGNVSQVLHENVKRILAKVNDKDEIRNLYDARRLTPTFRDGTDGLQPESCDTIKGMWVMAQAAREDFEKYSENVKAKFAEITPILIKRPKLKGEKRAKEKLKADEEAWRKLSGEIGTLYDEKTDTYHCRTLRDVDGHTFCCTSIEGVSKMLDHFISDKERIIRIKNNFANPSSVGYSDINMNIRLPNGTIAEIQLNTMANMVAKERYGHALYEVWRSLNENQKYKDVAEAMSRAQEKLYGLSNELSKSGKFPKEITNPFGATYQPYAESIRMDLRKALPSIEIAYNTDNIDEETYEHIQDLVKRIG